MPQKSISQILSRGAMALFAATLTGCFGTYTGGKVNFNPDQPLRVAVLPFVSIDDKGQIADEEGRLLIDNLSLVSSKQAETPPQIVRRQVLSELQESGLDLVSQPLIDIDLPHRGFARSDGSIDIKRVYATSAQELCTKFLNCDAVLYGKITRWDRSYYGIQSVNSVGINLRLIGAKDGKVLFESSADDSESRGLTKGPTGFSDLVIEPIKGLDSAIIVELSRNVVEKMLEPLRVDRRPKYLESGPPAIFASGHDGQNGPVSDARPLHVLAAGSPNQIAAFSIGHSVTGDVASLVPMVEVNPGHYYGQYSPEEGERFSQAKVTVHFSDSFGRSTEQRIPGTISSR